MGKSLNDEILRGVQEIEDFREGTNMCYNNKK